MIVAQAVAEHGLLDALVTGVDGAMSQLDLYLGPGNARWAVAGLAVVAVFFLIRSRR
jgi:hypothetical protein